MRVWVVIELHADCPKIRGVYSTKDKAMEVAYADTEYWRNIFPMEIDKTNQEVELWQKNSRWIG